jgi:Uma2 family endonuclease
MVAADPHFTSHRRLLTVDDLMRMVSARIIREDERVELIEGELITMSPINAPHSGILSRFLRLFFGSADGHAVIWSQSAVQLSERTLPQPDVIVLRPRSDDYVSGLPTVADILLVIEIADTTLADDFRNKVPLYAAHRVPEVWLADVKNRKVIRFRDPAPEGYRQVDEPTGVTAPALLAACAIDLAKVFPP